MKEGEKTSPPRSITRRLTYLKTSENQERYMEGIVAVPGNGAYKPETVETNAA